MRRHEIDSAQPVDVIIWLGADLRLDGTDGKRQGILRQGQLSVSSGRGGGGSPGCSRFDLTRELSKARIDPMTKLFCVPDMFKDRTNRPTLFSL